jgi:hypothetical protein
MIPSHLIDPPMTYEAFAIQLLQGQHMKRSLKRSKPKKSPNEKKESAPVMTN